MLRFKHPWLAQESAARAFAMDRAAHAFARIRYAMPDAHPERHTFACCATSLPRYERREHLLDAYVPARHLKPLPVVMYVHGGGFAMLSKDTHYVMAMAFARRGYLVFNINYRLGPKHVFPEPLEDAARPSSGCTGTPGVRRRSRAAGHRRRIGGRQPGERARRGLGRAHAAGVCDVVV